MDTLETFLVLVVLAGRLDGAGAWTGDRSHYYLSSPLSPLSYLMDLYLGARTGASRLLRLLSSSKHHADPPHFLRSLHVPGILHVLVLQIPVVHVDPVLH